MTDSAEVVGMSQAPTGQSYVSLLRGAWHPSSLLLISVQVSKSEFRVFKGLSLCSTSSYTKKGMKFSYICVLATVIKFSLNIYNS